jgi:hypothetical protein
MWDGIEQPRGIERPDVLEDPDHRGMFQPLRHRATHRPLERKVRPAEPLRRIGLRVVLAGGPLAISSPRSGVLLEGALD